MHEKFEKGWRQPASNRLVHIEPRIPSLELGIRFSYLLLFLVTFFMKLLVIFLFVLRTNRECSRFMLNREASPCNFTGMQNLVYKGWNF